MKTVINEKAFFFQKRSLEWRFLKTPGSSLRVDGRKRRFSIVFPNRSCEIFYDFLHFSPVNVFLSFSCGRAKAFQIRYVSTRIF